MPNTNDIGASIDIPARIEAAKIATLVPRAIAYWIDTMCVMVVIFLFIWATGLGHARNDGLFLLGCSAVFSYFLLTEWKWGRTIGKWAVGLRVVDSKGQRITIGQSALRTVLRIFEASGGPLVLIGAAFIGFTKYGQRVGDLAAGTYVVPVHLLTARTEQRFSATGPTQAGP